MHHRTGGTTKLGVHPFARKNGSAPIVGPITGVIFRSQTACRSSRPMAVCQANRHGKGRTGASAGVFLHCRDRGTAFPISRAPVLLTPYSMKAIAFAPRSSHWRCSFHRPMGELDKAVRSRMQTRPSAPLVFDRDDSLILVLYLAGTRSTLSRVPDAPHLNPACPARGASQKTPQIARR